ncbi:hypothetical protein Ga0102493_111770 [Erythrobacter litoralis]|jgi:hypothetical protein|uniref:Uncharacterized protein n=1 Tax=Erythrobacter litoralis TaxID=39960 RepID=A0A074N4I5_9SPHN|nr:hypothetical protein [Erythrobacter litoralis]AOL22792.1 hypothetical protein Ga0102493_111770 [Erythrobacter litoralis]KEO92907.1 hypothetical protein EH32_14035 [Erythrobacter litoralis]MEE4338310.1 hypothetical protein [Erythrobacter sp.]
MFSDKMKRRISRAALIGAALAMPVAAAAGVVVKSSGPSAGTYKVGTKVEDGASITLKAGDSVTVLTSKGTQVLRGAGTYTVGEKPKEPRLRFANFTRQGAAGRVRTGAVRTGETGELERPNMWYVDLTQPGTTCLYDFETVRLWRPDASEAATYTMVEPELADAVEVHFEAREAARVLNSERLMLAEGRSYAIRGPLIELSGVADEEAERETASDMPAAEPAPEAEPVRMTFALVDAYETPEQLAEMLIANGCTSQLAMMADRLEADAE